jgi:hypothetical protein
MINPMDPGEVRTLMHTVYDGYNSGRDMYPRYRFRGSPDQYPRRTQGVARAIFNAWSIIDEDRAYFNDSVNMIVDALGGINAEGESRLVLTRIGRNAVKMFSLQPGPNPQAMVGEFRADEFVEQMDGLELQLTDGGVVTLRDGQMNGEFDLAIARRSNVSGLVVSGPEQRPIEAKPAL